VKALNSAEVQAELLKHGMLAQPSSPQELANTIASESQFLGQADPRAQDHSGLTAAGTCRAAAQWERFECDTVWGDCQHSLPSNMEFGRKAVRGQ
jgi:hypothetical protein